MRRQSNNLSAWVRVFSLLVPVGPPIGLGSRDERALEFLAEYL